MGAHDKWPGWQVKRSEQGLGLKVRAGLRLEVRVGSTVLGLGAVPLHPHSGGIYRTGVEVHWPLRTGPPRLGAVCPIQPSPPGTWPGLRCAAPRGSPEAVVGDGRVIAILIQCCWCVLQI